MTNSKPSTLPFLAPIQSRSMQRKSPVNPEEQQLEQVKAIEIILTSHTEISIYTFENYEFIESIVLIDTSLSYIHPNSFHSVSQTLKHLNLSQQNLTDMTFLENQSLLFLEDLFLNDNHIKEISNLNSCRNLRRLWLYGNKISNLECAEIHYIGDLRELCLQSNLISRIKGLQCLNNLQSLQLASNPDIDDNLAYLPSLRHISFQDIHFGACPVTEENRFRQNMIKKVPQVLFIDMIEVTEEERYQQNLDVMNFNDQVEEVYNTFEKELAIIETERKFQLSDSNTPSNIAEMVNDLEAQIRYGLDEMHEKVQRNIELRNEKRAALEKSLLSISKAYENEIDKNIQQEKELSKMEQVAFDKMKEMKTAEYAHALFASRLEKKFFEGNYNLFYLDTNSEDFHWVDLCFRNSQVILHDNGDDESSQHLQQQLVSVQQCYCFLHNTQLEGNRVDVSSNLLQIFYLHGTENYIESIFHTSITKSSSNYSGDRYQCNEEFFLFYSNPLLAIKLKTVKNHESSFEMDKTNNKEAFADPSFFLSIEYNPMNVQIDNSSIISTRLLKHAPKSEDDIIAEVKEEDIVNFTFEGTQKESVLLIRILGSFEDNKHFEQEYTNRKAMSTSKIGQKFLDDAEILPSKTFHDDHEIYFQETLEKIKIECTSYEKENM